MSLYKFLRRLIVVPFFRLFYPTKIIKKDNFKEGKYIYICNHYASLDGFIICSRLFPKYMHALIKKELFDKPFLKWLLTKGGMISVDRENFDIKSYKRVLEVLNKNESIVIFPEGTRNKKNLMELAPIKIGAAIYSIKTQTPIIPMLFYNRPKAFRKSYLIIGEEINLSQFYEKKLTTEVKDEVILFIEQKLNNLRVNINNYVETKNMPNNEVLYLANNINEKIVNTDINTNNNITNMNKLNINNTNINKSDNTSIIDMDMNKSSDNTTLKNAKTEKNNDNIINDIEKN